MSAIVLAKDVQVVKIASVDGASFAAHSEVFRLEDRSKGVICYVIPEHSTEQGPAISCVHINVF